MKNFVGHLQNIPGSNGFNFIGNFPKGINPIKKQQTASVGNHLMFVALGGVITSYSIHYTKLYEKQARQVAFDLVLVGFVLFWPALLIPLLCTSQIMMRTWRFLLLNYLVACFSYNFV